MNIPGVPVAGVSGNDPGLLVAAGAGLAGSGSLLRLRLLRVVRTVRLLGRAAGQQQRSETPAHRPVPAQSAGPVSGL